MANPQNTLQMRNARQLYLQGHSVDDIALRVKKSATTVYSWLHQFGIDTGRTPSEPEPQAPSEPVNKFVDGTFEDGKAAGHSLAQQDPQFRVVCALYWGEGRLGNFADADISEVSLASSDVHMINIWMQWLLKCGLNDLVSVRVHVSMNNVISDMKLESFWRDKLRSSSYRGDVDVKRVDQYVTSLAAKTKHGSAYVTCHSHYLRGLIIGGITYLKSSMTK